MRHEKAFISYFYKARGEIVICTQVHTYLLRWNVKVRDQDKFVCRFLFGAILSQQTRNKPFSYLALMDFRCYRKQIPALTRETRSRSKGCRQLYKMSIERSRDRHPFPIPPFPLSMIVITASHVISAKERT